MGPDDRLCLSHRNAAYNLARAKSLATVLEHYRLTQPSAPSGLMGSMNLAVEGTSIAYSSSILGNNLAGGAPASRCTATLVEAAGRRVRGHRRRRDGGRAPSGSRSSSRAATSFRSSIVVENNDFSMSSTIAQRAVAVDLSQVCAGVGLRVLQRASGAIVEDVKAALGAARGAAAAGSPALRRARAVDVLPACRARRPGGQTTRCASRSRTASSSRTRRTIPCTTSRTRWARTNSSASRERDHEGGTR